MTIAENSFSAQNTHSLPLSEHGLQRGLSEDKIRAFVQISFHR